VAELIPFVVVLALLWFVLIQPQRRRRASQRALQDRLEPGDEVLTVGGLFGTVRSLTDDDVRLEVAPGTEIRVDRRAVARIVEPEEADSEPESRR
jgi:preprotein translocase subunit YajC